MIELKAAAAVSAVVAAFAVLVLVLLRQRQHSLVADNADNAPLTQPEHLCEWGCQWEESSPNVLSKPWWRWIFCVKIIISRTTRSCDVS